MFELTSVAVHQQSGNPNKQKHECKETHDYNLFNQKSTIPTFCEPYIGQCRQTNCLCFRGQLNVGTCFATYVNFESVTFLTVLHKFQWRKECAVRSQIGAWTTRRCSPLECLDPKFVFNCFIEVANVKKLFNRNKLRKLYVVTKFFIQFHAFFKWIKWSLCSVSRLFKT